MKQHSLHQVLVSREFGGAGEIALRFAKHCSDSEIGNVQIWVPGEGRAAARVRELDLPLSMYDLNAASSSQYIRSGIANLQLARRIGKNKHGLVHVHSPLAYGAVAPGLRLTGLKLVVHVQIEHGEMELRWAMRRPPHLVVTCAKFLIEQVRRVLPETVQSTQQIVAIPNAVDFSRFTPGDKLGAKCRVGAPLDRPLVLMLANLAPHKGQETAIRAVAHLRGRGLGVQCWLAGVDRSGDGAYERYLQRLINGLGLQQRVVLLGYRSDAPKLLRAADLMLLPSTKEGLPLALLEAQAAEVPVIAAPTAGVPEAITHDETGFLVAADDVTGYAEKMELLLQNTAVSKRIVSCAASRCRAEYCWSMFQRRMTDAYAKLLAS